MSGERRGWKKCHCAITFPAAPWRVDPAPRRILSTQSSYHDPSMAHESEHEHDSGRGLALETAKPEVARPPLFQVLLLNDDFTPMDFVVEVLRAFFNLDQEQAVQVMLHVHTRGRGVCGVFTREVAETKVTHVNEYSRSHQHPLLCTMEKL